MSEADSGALSDTSAPPDAWAGVAHGVLGWMRERDFRGWDPFDLLASPLVRGLSFGARLPAVAWTQLGRRSPVQLRGLLGVPRTVNPKTLGLVVAGSCRLEGGDEAVDMVERLLDLERPGGGWGYPFPWANRAFRVPADTPASVPTAFVGHALMDVLEGGSAVEGGEVEGAVVRAAEWARSELGRLPGPDGTFCFTYTPLDQRGVHNANALTASLLARAGRRLDDQGLLDAALRAARFTVRAQADDGSWRYGSGSGDRWIDSYHTGYLLWALETVGRALATDELDEAVDRGLRYWQGAFFRGPAVSLRPGGTYPVDMHAVAQAVLTALRFRDRLDRGRALAESLGRWSVRRMRAPDGHFHYRRHRLLTNRVPYMRWVQAWAFRAFAELAAVAADEPGTADGAGG